MLDRRVVVLLFCAGGMLSCDGSTGPEQRTDSELTFVRPAPDAPPLVINSQSLLVTKGADAEIRLFYRPRPGRTDSTEFVRLRLDARSLLRRPDGSAILNGQSVLITVTAVNVGSRLEVRLEPSGLRFDPNEAAELKIEFDECDHDFDEDGTVGDSDDEDIESRLGVWRQENIGLPWTRLTSRIEVDNDDVEADLTSFSNYALAF